MNLLNEIIEGLSTLLILAAFALLNFKVLAVTDISYLSCNLLGALGISYVAFKKSAFQPLTLNIIWALIAIGGIIKSI